MEWKGIWSSQPYAVTRGTVDLAITTHSASKCVVLGKPCEQNITLNCQQCEFKPLLKLKGWSSSHTSNGFIIQSCPSAVLTTLSSKRKEKVPYIPNVNRTVRKPGRPPIIRFMNRVVSSQAIYLFSREFDPEFMVYQRDGLMKG